MALSMVDRPADKKEASPWPADIAAEFECESKNSNPCVGTTLLSENERTRVWIIRLAPGERLGFHRHVLDYFWTAISGSRGRAHVQDGTTVEYTYQPNETRHGKVGKDKFTVHDLNVRLWPKRTWASALQMPAFGGKADMTFCGACSLCDPKADIETDNRSVQSRLIARGRRAWSQSSCRSIDSVSSLLPPNTSRTRKSTLHRGG
jgi:hypothetical protein